MTQTLQDLLSSRSPESQARIQEIAVCLLLAISRKEKEKEKELKTLNDAKIQSPKNNEK